MCERVLQSHCKIQRWGVLYRKKYKAHKKALVFNTDCRALIMISCDQHDYIEIACLYQLPVTLVMKTGHHIVGVAKGTCYNDSKNECILLDSDGVRHEVILEQIASMEAHIENPHFQIVHF